ncbi:unnamed protein product [Cuscuta epithymum]|uniref:Ubiquitin-like protease family profile domain-containing protein n=1 Tax=Cuscuta epithymum TaxID=186058 RepID=A0AAV0CM48_9ASTE|nr:unnamed protein product [Cuscuta epithymum]
MTLNIKICLILLLLDNNCKGIRVFDSLKRRGGSISSIRSFTPCLETLLPKMLERLGDYDKQPQADIGKHKILDGVARFMNGHNKMMGNNCGMFVIELAAFLMMDKDLSEVLKQNMDKYRPKMPTELLIYGCMHHEDSSWTKMFCIVF